MEAVRSSALSAFSLSLSLSERRASLSFPIPGARVRLLKTKIDKQYQPLKRSVSCVHADADGVASSGDEPHHHHHRHQTWDSHDADYAEAQVLDAVSLLPSQSHLFMTLFDGQEVEIDHINPAKGRFLFRSSNPTIFLKIEDEQDLLLPIIVGEVAIAMLMRGLHGDESLGRPNQYRLMMDLLNAMNYEVQMVRVTERVIDTYHASIYIRKAGEEGLLSVDSRPSDAINLAVRCKVPIYVHKSIVAADTVRPVRVSTHGSGSSSNSGRDSVLDCPENGHDPKAEEFTLMKNMLLAVVEERYMDAARWRDDMNKFRS